MKKKILSIALVLCMVLAVLPTATILQAATPTGTALTQDNIGSYTNLTGGSTESEMAYFYLSENVDVHQTLTVTGYVTLDLNGKALQQTAVPWQQALGITIITIGTDDTPGYLTITDSCGEGKIDIKYQDPADGSSSSFWVANGSATLNSGEIVSRSFPSVILIDPNASMTINGGKINKANGSFFQNAGILYANGGTVTSWFVNYSTGKITRTDGVTTFTTFEIIDYFENYGEINWGIFDSNVALDNYGTISGGIFNCEIGESGTITGGLFKTAPSGYETWDVTFKPENGEADAAYKAVKDTTITLLTVPAKNGFTFAGWYEKDTNGAFKDTSFDFANTKVSEDITLYAKWVCAGEHTGGTADCTHKAICEVCGEEYGSTNPDNHNLSWESENGQYWQKCTDCEHETAKKDIPEITINGADKVCRTQDYTFTFTLPEGVTEPKAAYYPAESDRPLVVTENDGVYTATVSRTEYEDDYNISKFFVKVYAKTEDGFEFLVRKEVLFSQEHTGGTADCTHKAKCEVCGDEYGEVDETYHVTLKHTEAKAATTEAEGNIEYWHCEECNKYFSDKDGKNEITLADTIIAKLTVTEEKTTDTPKTGDNGHIALWIALLFISGGTLAGITVYGKKKKRFVK